MQNLIVALVVGVCAWWVCWTLAPRPVRRWLALRILAFPAASSRWPLRWQAALQRAAQSGAGGGCACDAADGPGGCKTGPADWKPVQWRTPPPPPGPRHRP